MKINKNYIWSKLIIQYFKNAGIKDVCISPGSRNTPLVLAFAENKKINKHVIVDERSSGFFALGLAKASGKPVAVVTTSGTAVAELYPAIIEAFFQKIPLVVCTADRPHYLRNSGANQTINQENIFKNHIRFFADFGLPQIRVRTLTSIINLLNKAFRVLSSESVGPVHFNFPFDKPFEPSNTTDSIQKELLDRSYKKFNLKLILKSNRKTIPLKNLLNLISSQKKILILSGDNSEHNENTYLLKIAQHLNSPIMAGILSSVRFAKSNFVIKNASSFLKSTNITEFIQPDLILQFGYAPTSNSILDFFSKSHAVKIGVNNFNQKYDPSLTTKYLINQTAEEFFSTLIKSCPQKTDNEFLQKLKLIDSKTESLRNKFLGNANSFFEWNAYSMLINKIPENSNLMISNSLPIRDFDFIASTVKNVKVFSNRGASGIDGIISTAAGILQATGKITYLVIGDLAFYYDMNSLLLLKKYKIPLKIILINNNGGGIFELLPIADEKIEFTKYFKTPVNIDFAGIVKTFGGKYYSASNKKDFSRLLLTQIKQKEFSVLEIKINSETSKQLRLMFWEKISNSFLP